MKHLTSITVQQLASDACIDKAYAELCEHTEKKGDHHDTWHLRTHWHRLKPQIQQQLRNGEYRFSPCRSIKVNNNRIGIWNASDTLVIKALTALISAVLHPMLSKHCKHIKGHGGVKQAVMQAKRHSREYGYVLKSDVKSYYASMQHDIILKQLQQYIKDTVILDLVHQFLNHLDDVDAELFECTQGIGKGSALSPLLGALVLDALDQELSSYAANKGAVTIPYTDDWLLLCKTRWQLRTAVRKTNQVLQTLKCCKAEKKIFTGQTSKGYDWSGYRIEPVGKVPYNTAPQHADESQHQTGLSAEQGATVSPSAELKTVFALSVNKTSLQNHFNKFNRLYEQGASQEDLAAYLKRWWVWACQGVMLVA